MRDYFERIAEDPDYQRLLQELEPGYQYAKAISSLQERLGLTFEDFCLMIDVPEEELEQILMEFRVPSPDVIRKILLATRCRIEFRPQGEEDAAAAASF